MADLQFAFPAMSLTQCPKVKLIKKQLANVPILFYK